MTYDCMQDPKHLRGLARDRVAEAEYFETYEKDEVQAKRLYDEAGDYEKLATKLEQSGEGHEKPYDSREDTSRHIARVQQLLSHVQEELRARGEAHDHSKLVAPEKEVFDVVTPLLKGLTYGSDEYKASLADMKPALDHHYAENRHHPEHFENGIDDMTLVDLIEMLCDWKAATERHANGDIFKSLLHNAERFGISEQLAKVLENTVKDGNLGLS